MAYVIPPAPRIAYDLDGSLGFLAGKSSAVTGPLQMSQAGLTALNGDYPTMFGLANTWGQNAEGRTTQIAPTGAWLALRFPTPMRIQALAYFGMWGRQNTSRSLLGADIQTSRDSTNGEDGTWSTILQYPAGSTDFSIDTLHSGYNTAVGEGQAGLLLTTYPNDTTGVSPLTYNVKVHEDYRKRFDSDGRGWHPIAGAASRNVTWVRIRPTSIGAQIASGSGSNDVYYAIFKLHLYGAPDDTATDDRLVFQNTDGSAKLFDWGNVGLEKTYTQTFRVHNVSTDKTATGVAVGVQASAPDNTAYHPYTALSMSVDDGATWTNTVTLPDLAPGATSGTVILRLQVQPRLLGNWAPRLKIEVEEWV